jgi:hypothetical protein
MVPNKHTSVPPDPAVTVYLIRNQRSKPHDCQVIQKIESCCHGGTAKSMGNNVVVEDEGAERSASWTSVRRRQKKHAISHVIMFPTDVKHESINSDFQFCLVDRCTPTSWPPLFPWLSQPELLPLILDAIARSWCPIMGNEPSDLRDGGRIVHLTLTTPPPTVVFVNLKPFAALLVVLFYASFVHSARTGHPRSLSSS